MFPLLAGAWEWINSLRSNALGLASPAFPSEADRVREAVALARIARQHFDDFKAFVGTPESGVCEEGKLLSSLACGLQLQLQLRLQRFAVNC